MSAAPELLNGLTSRQLRSLLEACTRSDYVRAVPEIAYLIAHPSHTTQTLTEAWESFRRSTRDVSALHAGNRYWREFFGREELFAARPETAMQIQSVRADEAWRLIISGPSG